MDGEEAAGAGADDARHRDRALAQAGIRVRSRIKSSDRIKNSANGQGITLGVAWRQPAGPRCAFSPPPSAISVSTTPAAVAGTVSTWSFIGGGRVDDRYRRVLEAGDGDGEGGGIGGAGDIGDGVHHRGGAGGAGAQVVKGGARVEVSRRRWR